MSDKTRTDIRFVLGGLCVTAAVVGAFFGLAWHYFFVIIAIGGSFLGKRSVAEKIIDLLRRR